ncbi:hypothetical protein BDN67DRAFT_961908 [Paxillus ammoniavirescens]|nr:hypothetical protein BDN67DRAFT_961908 [Paxillus ammoniavirescens]
MWVDHQRLLPATTPGHREIRCSRRLKRSRVPAKPTLLRDSTQSSRICPASGCSPLVHYVPDFSGEDIPPSPSAASKLVIIFLPPREKPTGTRSEYPPALRESTLNIATPPMGNSRWRRSFRTSGPGMYHTSGTRRWPEPFEIFHPRRKI